MTPPDPATPSPLEALLAAADAADAASGATPPPRMAPRLAAIVLTMRCALTMMIGQIPWVQKSPAAAEGCLSMLKGALKRADEIAEGK